jgi:hypothetical protein
MSITLDKTVDFSHVMAFMKKQTATIEIQEKELVRMRAASTAQDIVIQGLVKDMEILKARKPSGDPAAEAREIALKNQIAGLEVKLLKSDQEMKDNRAIALFFGIVATGGLVYVAGPAALALFA